MFNGSGIVATGGDLNIIGNQDSGQDVALAAQSNLNFLSQSENQTLQSNSQNISGGVGLQIGTDGFGIYAQAAVGKGSAHGNGIAHTDTTVNADGTLTLISGNDTTIQGAQLTGNTVLAAIGNNLLIQSEQDTDDYASKQWQASGKVVIGMGGGGGGGLSYNQSKVDSHYASVNNVSGIQAGDGGFDITVGGNTHLIGGVIASSADASKNSLDTGSLTYENIHNQANYSASSIGVSGSYNSGAGEFGRNGFSGMPGLGIPQKGNSSSDTNAGIAQGTILVRDGNADLSGLDRHPTLDNQALNPIFDAQKVQEQMEMGQLAGQVGMRAAGDLAGQMGWAEGSTERTILHGVVGAGIAVLGGGDIAQGALGAAANQLVVQKMADYLESQGYTPGSPEFATMLQLASTAVGAAVGGGAGAATALDGTTYNYLSHKQRDQKTQELEACGSDQACVSNTEAKWQRIGDDQNIAMAEWVVAQGTLPPSLVDQLRDTDPSSAAYVALLNQAVTIVGGSTYPMNRQLINETDGSGLPAMMAPPLYKYPTDSIYQIPFPDYVSAGGNGLGAYGAVAMNLHDGQMYGSGGGSIPVAPGAGFVFGWILNGKSNVLDSGKVTDNFLGGAGASGAGCYFICIGVNHSFGGATAVEIGWGLGVKNKISGSGGASVTAPIPGTGSNWHND